MFNVYLFNCLFVYTFNIQFLTFQHLTFQYITSRQLPYCHFKYFGVIFVKKMV